MIAQAILTSKEQKMTLRDIYNWVQEKYPHLYETNEIGWQNTIRHNLSLNRCFYKLPKSSSSKGKGSYWTIDKQQLYHTTFGRFLLDTYSSSKGFEYWSNESPLSSSSSFIMDIDEEKDINQNHLNNHHTQIINNNNSQPPHYLIQPSNLVTLQHHQQHLNQYPSKSISSSISISSSTSSSSSDDNNIHFLKSPTFHPNSLHFIL
ncbi:fork head domain-containing protein, partial [Cunninghamella echinulata]